MALLHAAQVDGFDIELVFVVGGDHVHEAVECGHIDGDESTEPTVIFSDGVRLIPRTLEGAPLTLLGYGGWQKASAPDARLIAML